ncbi:MAG: ribbon-helix-helix domain-containing protein, partial [Sulfolobales archaeon]|nr:ribbon-helix-helix domain-containing protein [Sulfolobales archaeon]
ARYIQFPEKIVRSVATSIGRSVEDVVEGISRILESLQQGLGSVPGRASQVVSVRVRDRDLEVIDQLVDAGIFKSRSDAISYFARKGIEASREWIGKALEQAKKIKELQESIRRELGEEEFD